MKLTIVTYLLLFFFLFCLQREVPRAQVQTYRGGGSSPPSSSGGGNALRGAARLAAQAQALANQRENAFFKNKNNITEYLTNIMQLFNKYYVIRVHSI